MYTPIQNLLDLWLLINNIICEPPFAHRQTTVCYCKYKIRCKKKKTDLEDAQHVVLFISTIAFIIN